MPKKEQVFYRSDYRPYPWEVVTTELRFDLQPEATLVRSKLVLKRKPDQPGAPLILDGENLELLQIRLDGHPLPRRRYQLNETGLTIIDLPSECLLETLVRINPRANTALEGLYLSNGTFCTQCEAQGFRRITFYPDRPDVLSRFTTHLIADGQSCPVLLSNGNPVERQTLDDGRLAVTWQDPFPKPCYLFALVAGDLEEIRDSFKTRSGRTVDLRFYVEHHHRDKVGHAVRALKKAMRWDEEHFGREYDLDIYMVVAVDDFNMGAMENKGLNIFNSKYVLASNETATDADFQAIEEVIAHEYFHNWTGNRITCRDWFQLSLKEGLTVFRDQEFSADQVQRAIKRIEDVRLLRNSQFPEDAGPMAHPVRPDSYRQINNFYTMTVYHKGAEVVRMLQTLLGQDAFRAGMNLYFDRHDGQAVTCDDFLAAMEDASGRDLKPFGLWYSQAGTPTLKADWTWSAEAGCLSLTLEQSCPPTPGQTHKEPFVIPVRLALLAGDGRPMRLDSAGRTELVLELTEKRRTFEFHRLPEKPVPSLLRGFSAPVRLDTCFSDDELAFLLARDNDPFCRWDAGQTLLQRTLLQGIDALANDREIETVPLPLEALKLALEDESADPALRALLLTPPAESFIAEQCDPADPGLIHRARRYLLERIGRHLEPQLLETIANLQQPGPYDDTAEAAGRRSLINHCLALLTPVSEDGRKLARDRYHGSDNMTDRFGALKALVHAAADDATDLLEDFHHRFRDQPLVIDKWFALQATIPGDQTVERVRELATHADFRLNNPNRCRALFGSFAHGNQAAFHRQDGAGYRLVADTVIQLDGINPQVAARLVSSFNRWARTEPGRRRQMHEELARMHAECRSSDVTEILERALEQATED